jgi:hypothetical protein
MTIALQRSCSLYEKTMKNWKKSYDASKIAEKEVIAQ